MNENEWDKLLKIHTTGTDNTDADQYRYPYEPTPYSVLEWLGNSGWIRKENTLWLRQRTGGLLSFLSDTLSFCRH